MNLAREQSEELYRDALKYARDREVKLPGEYYDALPEEARQWAFSVAGISRTDQLQSVLDDVNEAVAEGVSFRKWKQRALSDPNFGGLPDYRLENIFRTNVQSAYNQGRGQQFLANRRRRPYLMYDAIGDVRTRPAHAAMDGHIAQVGAPIWATWTPPVGYQCRCRHISLSERQARARGLESQGPAPNAEADRGWDYDRRPRERPTTWREGAQRALDSLVQRVAPELINALRGLIASGVVDALQLGAPGLQPSGPQADTGGQMSA